MPQLQILGKVRRYLILGKKVFENMGGKNFLENVSMGNKFGLGEGAAEGSCLSSR